MSGEYEAASERPHPRELVERKESELQRTIEALEPEIMSWNFQLANAWEEDHQNETETMREIAFAAVDSLDGKWPFEGDWLTISGVWVKTKGRLIENGIVFDSEMEEVFTAAMSNGFTVNQTSEDQLPAVGFSFKVGQALLQNQAVQGSLEFLAFASPDKVSLSYVRPGEKHETEIAPLKQAAEYYDMLLRLHTHNPNSEFYRKSVKSQQMFFSSVIDDLSEILTAPDFATMCSSLKMPYVYRRGHELTPDGAGLGLEMVQLKDQSVVLSGRVIGVTILDSLFASTAPLKSKEDLIDDAAGVCFIINANQGNLEDEQVDERPFIVPIRYAEQLDLDVS